MFKALTDATNYEIRVRSNSKEPSNIAVTPGSTEKPLESESTDSNENFPLNFKT